MEDLDAQMDAYIAERDRLPDDSIWKRRKPLSVALFRLLDQFSSATADYERARNNMINYKGSSFHLTRDLYPFDPETIKQATTVFYAEQDRLHKILIRITSLRKEISKTF